MPGPYRLTFSSPGSVNSNFDAAFGVEYDTASGAIAIKEGVVSLNGTGVLAMTLAVPTAGLPSSGGDDGRCLRIKSVSAYAHTITTPANGVNGNHHVITFGGAVTDFIELIALAGAWTTGGQSGATIS